MCDAKVLLSRAFSQAFSFSRSLAIKKAETTVTISMVITAGKDEKKPSTIPRKPKMRSMLFCSCSKIISLFCSQKVRSNFCRYPPILFKKSDTGCENSANPFSEACMRKAVISCTAITPRIINSAPSAARKRKTVTAVAVVWLQ